MNTKNPLESYLFSVSNLSVALDVEKTLSFTDIELYAKRRQISEEDAVSEITTALEFITEEGNLEEGDFSLKAAFEETMENTKYSGEIEAMSEDGKIAFLRITAVRDEITLTSYVRGSFDEKTSNWRFLELS